MNGASRFLRQTGEYLYFTFRIRKWLLRSLVIMAVVPGIFLFELPIEVRRVFAYVFVSLMAAGVYAVANVYAGSAAQTVAVGLLSKKYRNKEYSTPAIEQLKKRMSLDNVKVLVTPNPVVKSAFTTPMRPRVYLPSAWLTEFPSGEILSIIGHELGHVETRRRFALEVAAAIAAVLAFSFLLAFRSIAIVVQVTEFAALVLALTYVSWRNERRADLVSARELGPEGLISVLQQLKTRVKRDEGSETHPPLSDRIRRLVKLLG